MRHPDLRPAAKMLRSDLLSRPPLPRHYRLQPDRASFRATRHEFFSTAPAKERGRVRHRQSCDGKPKTRGILLHGFLTPTLYSAPPRHQQPGRRASNHARQRSASSRNDRCPASTTSAHSPAPHAKAQLDPPARPRPPPKQFRRPTIAPCRPATRRRSVTRSAHTVSAGLQRSDPSPTTRPHRPVTEDPQPLRGPATDPQREAPDAESAPHQRPDHPARLRTRRNASSSDPGHPREAATGTAQGRATAARLNRPITEVTCRRRGLHKGTCLSRTHDETDIGAGPGHSLVATRRDDERRLRIACPAAPLSAHSGGARPRRPRDGKAKRQKEPASPLSPRFQIPQPLRQRPGGITWPARPPPFQHLPAAVTGGPATRWHHVARTRPPPCQLTPAQRSYRLPCNEKTKSHEEPPTPPRQPLQLTRVVTAVDWITRLAHATVRRPDQRGDRCPRDETPTLDEERSRPTSAASSDTLRSAPVAPGSASGSRRPRHRAPDHPAEAARTRASARMRPAARAPPRYSPRSSP